MSQTRISRRRFLGMAGATSVVVAGGLVWRAADQGVFSAAQGPAYTAWDTWRTDPAEGPMALVRAGILAASPHNTQPWIFQIADDTITLYADTARHLGTMDPYLREMHLGLGCAVENMMLTGAAQGYDVALTLAEGDLQAVRADSGLQQVAQLRLTASTPQPSPLHDAIPQRRTNRFDYTGEALPAAIYDALTDLNADDDIRLFLFPSGTTAFQEFAAGTITGVNFIVADAQMAHDSFAWFPRAWDEVQRDKAGPYIDTAGVSPLMRAVVKMVPGMPSQTAVDNTMVADAARHMETASAVGLIAVRSLYDIGQSLRAGRLWQRMHLWGTSAGLAMQPHNEMPEVVDRERQLGLPPQMAEYLTGITGDSAWHPTFTFRLGKPTVAPLPSARRPVDEVVSGVGV